MTPATGLPSDIRPACRRGVLTPPLADDLVTEVSHTCRCLTHCRCFTDCAPGTCRRSEPHGDDRASSARVPLPPHPLDHLPLMGAGAASYRNCGVVHQHSNRGVVHQVQRRRRPAEPRVPPPSTNESGTSSVLSFQAKRSALLRSVYIYI